MGLSWCMHELAEDMYYIAKIKMGNCEIKEMTN